MNSCMHSLEVQSVNEPAPRPPLGGWLGEGLTLPRKEG